MENKREHTSFGGYSYVRMFPFGNGKYSEYCENVIGRNMAVHTLI